MRTADLCRKLAAGPREAECIRWPFSVNGAGYGQACVDGEAILAHRYICELAHGPAPSADHEAAHSCGRGHEGCVNWSHLRWATRSENQRDRHQHGTMVRGAGSHHAVLTEAQTLAIYHDQRTHRAIADDYGIGRQTVTNIKLGESWAWLTQHGKAAA